MPDKPDSENAPDPLDTEEVIRRTAYFLWQQDGSGGGQDERYWQLAREKIMRERAYDLWLKEGTPDGRAEEHWRRIESGETPRQP